LNALQVRLAAAREEPEAQAALAEEVLAQGVSPGVLLGALKDPDLVWALDFWRRLAQDFRTPPDVLVALLEHPLATLTQEAARTLVDHPGATEKHLRELGKALFKYFPFFAEETRNQLLDALKRRDERIWGMAKRIWGMAKLAHF
jgi:hypothetical protein